jgi:hypothetical protein
MSLHAGCFTRDGAAVAIAGAPEAGKSTIMAELALRGERIASDDVVPLVEEGGEFRVEPTYPRVRLWDDSVRRLFGSSSALPLLTPSWDKRYLDVSDRGLFETRPLPLRALFVLDARTDEDDAPRVERLRGRAAIVAILAQLHSVWMLPLSPQRAHFELAGRLARAVPVFGLAPHRDPARLGTMCDRILATLDGCALAAAGKADVPTG